MKAKMRIYALIIAALILTAAFIVQQFRQVKIYGAHQGEFTAQIIVDRLPLTDKAKINWWKENEEKINSTYRLRAKNQNGTLDYYVYAWGEGYKITGEKDEICFKDIAPPANCLEKNILMSISVNAKGESEFRIADKIYIKSLDGNIGKVNVRP